MAVATADVDYCDCVLRGTEDGVVEVVAEVLDSIWGSGPFGELVDHEIVEAVHSAFVCHDGVGVFLGENFVSKAFVGILHWGFGSFEGVFEVGVF